MIASMRIAVFEAWSYYKISKGGCSIENCSNESRGVLSIFRFHINEERLNKVSNKCLDLGGIDRVWIISLSTANLNKYK